MCNRWASGDEQGAMRSRWVLRTGLSFLALSMLAGMQAGAQADLNCGDFATQRDAQVSLNNSYPDDPNRLDADKDWIACEDFFKLTDEEAARVVPANLINAAGQSTPTPRPEPSRLPAPDDAAPAPPVASISQGRRCRLCATTMISSRSLAHRQAGPTASATQLSWPGRPPPGAMRTASR